ncbi:histidine kinase [Micromonospora rosaria]|uniref:histidine kinase n=1 Tax=Micromonospora rosaria TaxID=47874 RepID=A0A136PSM4_9ACTN|nr:sensor histidine kinase [Micromonospora rosaria]KXK61463.1 histidine kinase [Micromonospora rosaria]
MDTTSRERWRRPGPTPQQRRTDLWIGLAVTALALVSLALARSAGVFVLGVPHSVAEQAFWAVAATLPLAWRRRWPEAVTLVISVAYILGQARSAPESQVTSGALFAAIYTLGAWGRDRRLARRLRLGVIGSMFAWLVIFYLVRGFQDVGPDAFSQAVGPVPPILAVVVNTFLINALFFGFAYLFGDTAWVAARRDQELREQAEELRRSQAQARERAVIGERVRIARELHDVVAHHVSVMGVQAAACRRVFDRNPDAARTALSAIEETARTAVDELRRMLGLLRASGPERDDRQPGGAGLDQIAGLVDRARDAGLQATVGVYGDPVPLPDSVSQAAYRIVQEAVTNTLKHARATVLDVRIRYLAQEVEVDVTDNGQGGAVPDDRGLGLIGMRERVTAHDGALEVGPRFGGGWRVRARFPVPATVAEQPA